MIKFIKSVKEDIAKKDVYVWNVNVDSMNLFVSLGIMLIDVKGFVLPPYIKDDSKKTIMNRPLVSIEEFNKKDNAVLITADYCETIMGVDFPIDTLIYKYNDEIFETDRNLYEKNVYVYGTGKGAKRIKEYLNNENIKITGYVTTTSARGGGGRKIYKSV